MGNQSTLLKSTLIYTIGNLGSRILSFALLPLYSFYLSKSELGYYDLIVTTIILIIPVLTIQISDATYRWLLDAKGNREQQGIAISNGTAVIAMSLGALVLIYLVWSSIYHIDYSGYCLMLVVTYTCFPFLQQIARGLGNNKLYATASILNSVSIASLSCSFLMLSQFKFRGLLVSTILANSISILYIAARLSFWQLLKRKWVSRTQISKMAGYSWPLIPNLISWWLINEVNRFIILFNLGAEENGIFAIAIRFPSLNILVNSIFMLAWQDHAIVATEDEANIGYTAKIFNLFLKLQLCCVLMLISVSKPVVAHFVSSSFAASWQYMPFLYLGVAFSSFAGFIGTRYLGSRQTKKIFTTTIFGSLFNILISFSLVHKLGLYAPAIGTLVGFLVMWLLRLRDFPSRKMIEIRPVIILILLIAAATVLNYFDNTAILYGTIAGAILVSYLMNRPLLNSLAGTVKAKLAPKQKNVTKA